MALTSFIRTISNDTDLVDKVKWHTKNQPVIFFYDAEPVAVWKDRYFKNYELRLILDKLNTHVFYLEAIKQKVD